METREFESSELQLARFKISVLNFIHLAPLPRVWILIFRNERVELPMTQGTS